MGSVFQFHNGTIKGKRKDEAAHKAANFNSTMVRLKVDHIQRLQAWDLQFQFHNGTIKGALSNKSDMTGYVFQFHNGTIKGVHNRRRSGAQC